MQLLSIISQIMKIDLKPIKEEAKLKHVLAEEDRKFMCERKSQNQIE